MNEYSINELIDVLDMGAEINFIFKNQKYSLSQSKGKIILTKHSQWAKYTEFDTAIDLVTKGEIDDKPFDLIWKDVVVTMWF